MPKNSQNKKKLDLTEELIKQAAENAANQTNAQLDARIASMTILTQQDIQKAFPTKSDKQKLDELIQIVKSSMSRQEKINAIVDKSERFADIIVTLLGRFI